MVTDPKLPKEGEDELRNENKSDSPSYIQLLDEKKKELLDIEERIDKKNKELIKNFEAASMAGRGFMVQQTKKEETPEEYTARVLRGEL